MSASGQCEGLVYETKFSPLIYDIFCAGTSRRMSDLHLTRSLQTEVKEKRLVDIYLIRAGMLRFSLLMSVSEPGSLPEPEFLAALLTLVSTRCHLDTPLTCCVIYPIRLMS